MAKKSRKKINTGLIVGIIAITINIITVTVYLFQTNIMQSQQHASVWPYLEWSTRYNQDDGFFLTVKNNGIGPALVKKSNMQLNGEEIPDINSLLIALIDSIQFPHLTNYVDNRVLPAGESINLITVKDNRWSEFLYYKLKENNFKMEICYESIYEEQWITKGMEVVEGTCE